MKNGSFARTRMKIPGEKNKPAQSLRLKIAEIYQMFLFLRGYMI